MENEAPAPAAPNSSTTSKPDEPDPRASLRHVLAQSPSSPPSQAPSVKYLAGHPPAANRTETPPLQPSPAPAPTPAAVPATAPTTTPAIDGPQAPPGSQGSQGPQNLAAITYTLRKNANGGVSTVYSGSKIKYLKKDDGLPFWRRDIQFSFLRHVFQDKAKVFTKLSNGTKGHTFAEVYVDAMANSSKCSQILKEKLLTDTSDQALDMAMVCLLVNVGRMNTTVNFFPEMRARVRTFHSIPCLQTHQNPQAYKQLQDGPRLKSILKGAMEDTPQPNNLEELANHAKPRTNPVSLIFVLAQYAPRISDLHFPAGTDFFDLFMRDTLSSRSRAKALLWIIWWYLESDFTAEDSQHNPFGKGRPSNASDAMIEGLNVMKGVQMRVPEFEILTEEEAANENVDPSDEVEYGETKRLEREAILASDAPPPLFASQKRPAKNSDNHTPYSSSIIVDESLSTSVIEPQQNRRFRNYSSSPTRSGDTRGRLTPTPDHPVARDEHGNRSRTADRDRTQSGTPAPTIEQNTSNGVYSSYNQHGQSTPEGEPRKGPGRGNYPRRIKAHSTQPFEQMYHPDQFKGTSAASSSHAAYQHGTEPRPRAVLPSNGSSYGTVPPNGHKAPPPPTSNARYYPHNGHSTRLAPLAPPPSAAAAPTTNEQPCTTTEQPPPTKRTRQTAERHRAVEQSRNDRVSNIIESNILAIREAKRRERRRRGIIVDAWIKARALPEYYDSEDEAEYFERHGGIDDVRSDGGIEVAVPVSTASGIETKKMRWNPGDVGQQAGFVAETWRKMARLNGIAEIVERSRRRTRGAERDKDYGDSRGADDDHTKMDVDIDDPDHADRPHAGKGRRHSPLAYPTSNFAHKNATLAPAARSKHSPADAPDDDGATVTAEPTPKKRRRIAVRRPKGSAGASKTAAHNDDERHTQPRGPRGGRRAAGTSSMARGTRRRRFTAESASVAVAAAGPSASKEPRGAASQPGSFAWFLDTGEKMEAERRGKQARSKESGREKAREKASGKDKGKEQEQEPDEGEGEDEKMADEGNDGTDGKREVDEELLADADVDV